MKDFALKAAFVLFAMSLIIAAIAFNLEKMKMFLIFFSSSLVFAVIMVGLNRLAVGIEKSRTK